MGNLVYKSLRGYTNSDAIENLVYYLINMGSNTDPTERLLFYDVIGANPDPDMTIAGYKYVQKACRCSGNLGTKVFHDVFKLSENEATIFYGREDLLYSFSKECAYIYYNLGHQVLFAARCGEKNGLTIHFGGNAVSCNDSSKWYRNSTFAADREERMNQFMQKYLPGAPVFTS